MTLGTRVGVKRFGLHHVWNVPFFFQAGEFVNPVTGATVNGEIARFIAGDPTAGRMTGGYLFKMWGLPAAAIAMWRSARPDQRAKVGGIMISAALTAFLTGITEPIEFAFMFVAPLLYVIHAILAGVAYFLCIELGIKHGMTFSHGLIDFIVLFNRSSNALWFLAIGPLWARLPIAGWLWLAAGGVAYTAGVAFFAAERLSRRYVPTTPSAPAPRL